MMFSSSKNVELICQLIKDFREYGSLRLERFELDMASKLALAVGMLAMCAIVTMLALVGLVFFSMAVAYWLAPLCGSTALAFLIMAAAYAVVALVVYAKREKWIITPLKLFLHNLFLNEKQ